MYNHELYVIREDVIQEEVDESLIYLQMYFPTTQRTAVYETTR